jgi:acyl dehydratase
METEPQLVYEFFRIGMQLPVYVHEVTKEEIDIYCKLLQERNPIYWNDETAKKMGLQGRIAPPMFVRKYAHFQNVLKGFKAAIPGHTIHASGEYHFLNPVRPGDTVTTTGTVIEKFTRRGRKFLSFELISKNQNGQTVVINRHTSIWPK